MKKLCLVAAFYFVAASAIYAQMTTRVVRDSLFIPWELVYAPDSNIWFTQKNGYICRMDPASGHIDTLYYEANTYIQAEGGMLGLAIDPNFPASPYVYVAYNFHDGSYKERIVKYTYSNNSLSGPQTLIDNIAASNYHSGCRLLIIDGKLFITTGDATNQSTPQDLSSVNGKTLRINLDGSIPSDNPIAGNPVWSWGHRNAQGLVYANNKLYSSEHGPNSDDELNIIYKGRNYGWPEVEGFCDQSSELNFCNDSNVAEPLMAWTPTLAVCGIDYYNHLMFPSLQNSLLMTTLKNSKLYQLKLNGSFDSILNSTVVNGVSFGRLRDICIGPYGNIFISTSNSNASGSNRIDKIIEIYDPSFVPPSSGVPNYRQDDIALYPNPATHEININIARAYNQPLQYSITGMEGKLLLSGLLSTGTNKLPVTQLAKGMYILRILSGSELIKTEKIVKTQF